MCIENQASILAGQEIVVESEPFQPIRHDTALADNKRKPIDVHPMDEVVSEMDIRSAKRGRHTVCRDAP